MFALAQQLNHFQQQDLDVHRKIANLGEKTFRWEQGSKPTSKVQLHFEFDGQPTIADI